MIKFKFKSLYLNEVDLYFYFATNFFAAAKFLKILVVKP